MSKKERIVCVEWDDASFNSGYYDKKSPEKFGTVKTRTVGHFIRATPKTIIVSQERYYADNGKIEDDRHISSIPKKMIRKITELRGKDE